MQKLSKRLLTVVTVLALLVSMMAMPAMATETDPDNSGELTNSTQFVAQVGDTQYADLQEAITAAANGGTVTLLNDIAVESDLSNAAKGLYNIADGQKVTIDLNGKTINVTDNSAGNFIVFYNYGELTIKNGAVNLTATNDRGWNAQSTIILNRGGVLYVESGTYTHNGGSSMAFVVDNSGNSYGDATAYISGSTLTSSYIGIRNRMDTFGANGGGNGIPTLNISSGTISGKYAVWGQVSSTSAKGIVNVTGGTLTAAAGKDAILIDEDSAPIEGGIVTTVSGGTFSSDVSAYVVSGNKAALNDNDMYTIVADETTAVASVNGYGYTSLSAAIEAAANGQTVELLKDVTVGNEQIVTTAPLTLNGNGHTVTFTHEKPLRLNADATFNNVTLKNANGRAIELRKGGITVNLNNSTVEVTESNAQALTVGGNGEGGTVTVNISNSTISAPNGYGIITFNPVNLTLTNTSSSTGYGALYMKGVDNSKGSAGSVVNINGSTLSSTNNSSADTNEFGTIILETGNITVNVDASSTVSANANGDCSQWVVLLNNYYADDVQGNQVTFSATPTLGGETKNAALVGSLIDNNNTIQFPYSEATMAQLQAEGYDPTSDGTTITVYIKHTHELAKTPAVAASCTPGNIDYYTCSVCDKYFSDENGTKEITAADTVIPAEHKMTEVPAKEATCGDHGNVAYSFCSECETYFYVDADGKECSSTEKFDVTIHASLKCELTEVPAKDPTCIEAGNIKHFICSKCGNRYRGNVVSMANKISEAEVTIPATGEHSLTKVDAVEPTCTKTGMPAYEYCNVCEKGFISAVTGNGETIKVEFDPTNVPEEFIIPANGHELTKVEAKAATCTEDGVNAHYTCSGCDLLFNDPKGLSTITQQQATAKATGHNLTKTAAVAATCTTAGNIEYYTCSACKGIFSDAEGKTATTAEKVVVAVTAHTEVTVVGKAPTCTETGLTDGAKCSVCGAVTVEQKTVAATGHTLTKNPAVAPTYTAGGNIEHYACACGALFLDAEGKTATTAEAVKLAQLIKIDETEAKAEVSADAVDTAIKEAATTGSVTIDLVEVAEEEAAKPESGSDTKPAAVVTSAALPVASLEKVAEKEADLTVNMTEVTVTMDSKTMAAVAEQSAGETVTLQVVKVETETLTEKQQAVIEDKEVAVVITATMISNNTAISDFKGGEVTIAIPFTLPEGTQGSDFQVYYVADDGTMTAHDTEYKNGCLVFSTTHFSDYVVVNTAEPADPTVPNTGDNANMMLYTTALVISAAALAVLFIGKKKFSF